ncbi:MAG: methyl-accepting chemotaxis protein [Candidatus Omnitrophota bacterium]
MENSRNRRRNYFIDKRFQARFILRFGSLVLGGGFLTIALIYLLGSGSTTVAVQNSRVVADSTANFILPLLIQTVLAVTIVVGLAAGLLALFVSHKISGPLYHFKKAMEGLGEGDFLSELHIRSLDQFHGLADGINNMIRSTRQKLVKLKGEAENLKRKLDNLSEGDLPENKRQALAELKAIVGELDRAIRHFKT